MNLFIFRSFEINKTYFITIYDFVVDWVWFYNKIM